MKKVFFAILCIALAACVFTGCGRSKDMDTTTDTTNSTTTTTASTVPETSSIIDDIMPTTENSNTTPSQEATEAPSTIAPDGGTDSQGNNAGAGQRSMGRG